MTSEHSRIPYEKILNIEDCKEVATKILNLKWDSWVDKDDEPWGCIWKSETKSVVFNVQIWSKTKLPKKGRKEICGWKEPKKR